MFRPRVIPVLLLKGQGLVKTIKFNKERYIGDPINAVRIFNDLEVDELSFVDIIATKENRTISLDLVKKIGDEAFMPFAVGGGIKTIKQIKELIKNGAEKVIINSEAYNRPNIVKEAAESFGNQSVIVSIDVKSNFFGKDQLYSNGGRVKVKTSLLEHVQQMESMGAGEILLNSINHDGMMNGYNIELIKKISEFVSIPVIACGGAGNINDFRKAYYDGNAHAVAAGSRFVYHGPRNAVLINYPSKDELKEIFR